MGLGKDLPKKQNTAGKMLQWTLRQGEAKAYDAAGAAGRAREPAPGAPSYIACPGQAARGPGTQSLPPGKVLGGPAPAPLCLPCSSTGHNTEVTRAVATQLRSRTTGQPLCSPDHRPLQGLLRPTRTGHPELAWPILTGPMSQTITSVPLTHGTFPLAAKPSNGTALPLSWENPKLPGKPRHVHSGDVGVHGGRLLSSSQSRAPGYSPGGEPSAPNLVVHGDTQLNCANGNSSSHPFVTDFILRADFVIIKCRVHAATH